MAQLGTRAQVKRSGADNASALMECYRFGGIAFQGAGFDLDKAQNAGRAHRHKIKLAQTGFHAPPQNPVKSAGKP